MQGPNSNQVQAQIQLEQSCNDDLLKQMLSSNFPSSSLWNQTTPVFPYDDNSALMLHHLLPSPNAHVTFYDGSLQPSTSNHFQHPQPQSQPQPQPQTFGTSAPTSASGQAKQKVRARRGQATDPHSIAERLRRERIAERMKALQELVPNANKTDKASMLDEIIDYVKFLQLQVKVLSMSRLGGAAAVGALVAENEKGNESLALTEQQVAKLMEEDMGSAMQYLQGKGLCLMPISLATAISKPTSLTVSKS
ncbi:hypothetical protein Fmac_012950 [Flemingia macrophylla]|uniref:BHLH domain-containing protein n=1 Tax=Flemingia macrophylla TaxID=520843 RepID=A0ABD1MRR3_9FABA